MLKRIAVVLALTIVTATAGAAGTGSFRITGDHEAAADNATASISFNERAKIWMIQLRADRHTISMFFSRDFNPAPGNFPIRFNYMNSKNTLGGSVIVPSDTFTMLSHDTDGSVEFEVFDEQIRGSFEFTTYKGSKEPRDRVTVTGSFDLPRGDALQ